MADETVVGATRQLGLDSFHHLAHVRLGGGSQFGNHFSTVDNLSKGVEIELSAQPTRNWNVTMNYTHVNATHANIDPITQVFLSQMTGFLNGFVRFSGHVLPGARHPLRLSSV